MLTSANPSEQVADTTTIVPPQTLSELLHTLQHAQLKNFPALKSKASLLADLLHKSPDRVTIQDIEDIRPSLRLHLTKRRLTENSIRTYVNEIQFLLAQAKRVGWSTSIEIPPVWAEVMDRRTNPVFKDLTKYVMARKSHPTLVTSDDVESWIFDYVKSGGSFTSAKILKSVFGKVLSSCGHNQLRRPDGVGIPFESFPDSLKAEVRELLNWKTAVYAKGRSKKQRVRQTTSRNAEKRLSNLYGFAVNVLGETGIDA